MVLTMSPNNVSGPNNANEKTHGSPNNAVPAYARRHKHTQTHTHTMRVRVSSLQASMHESP
jgi:hypothetical protein